MRNNKISYRFLVVVAVSIAVLATVLLMYLISSQAFLYWASGKTWVQTDPTQCLTNPWEQDWLESNNNSYSSYPKDVHTRELEPEEIEIIKDYYQKQGIVVLDVKSKWTHGVVCAACFCPEGYTLYLLVSDSDVDRMQELGYEVS